MSCCTPAPSAESHACPRCGDSGHRVKAATLNALLTPKSPLNNERYRFCASQHCDVVWYSEQGKNSFGRERCAVPVGQKTKEPNRTICYCFNHTAAQLLADQAKHGLSTIRKSIIERCRAGAQQCEKRNPQGRCCLANVKQVLDEKA